jgi:hypothetical protein
MKTALPSHNQQLAPVFGVKVLMEPFLLVQRNSGQAGDEPNA